MYIAFTTNSKSWFSKGIRKFTKSRWSHTILAVDDVGSDNLIIEAHALGGVKFNLLSKYTLNPDMDIEIFKVNTKAKYLDCLIPFIGKNYGYLQILGFVIAKLFKMKTNPFTKGFICSELTLMWLLHAPEVSWLFEHLNPEKASPKNLYEIVVNSPQLFEKVDYEHVKFG